MGRLEIKSRNSGIELLRILMAFGIVVMHFNNVSIGGGYQYVEKGSVNYYFLTVFQGIALCSVNVFILIMGYFMVQKKEVSYSKAGRLFIEAVVFHIVSYIVMIGISKQEGSVHDFVIACFPSYYFVILYITLFLIASYINMILTGLTKKQYQIMLAILFGLFSIWPMVTDIIGNLLETQWLGLSTVGMYGAQNGYTIVWFVVMYCWGGVSQITYV